jgi:hypothetical protein
LDIQAKVPIVDRPKDIMVVVAGGKGRHSAVVPTFGGPTEAITVPVTDKEGKSIIASKAVEGRRTGQRRAF